MYGEVLAVNTAREFATVGGIAKEFDFVLVGGTALALHLGHRRSDDLDFFRADGFDSDALLERFQQQYGGDLKIVDAGEKDTLHLLANGVKVSFLRQTGGHLRVPVSFNGVQVATVNDLVAMKVNAISSRGAKKDFIDLYFVAQGGVVFATMIDLALAVFPRINVVHAAKSFTYFADAEAEPMPMMLRECSWPEVKQFFTAAAVGLQREELART